MIYLPKPYSYTLILKHILSFFFVDGKRNSLSNCSVGFNKTVILAEIMHTKKDKLILIKKRDEPSGTENPKESYVSMLIQENTRAGQHPSLEGR